MRLTDLMADDRLGLRLRTATSAARMRFPIMGVAPTELIEPSAFLAGHELITLAGIALNFQDARTWDAYVERLADVPIAGIVFNSGVAHARVPQALVDAGDRFDVPILEVSPPVNLLQVYRSVNDTLQAEYSALLRRSLALADRCAELEARTTTVGELLEEIAAATHGEAGLIDSQGQLVASHPPAMEWDAATAGADRAGHHVRHLNPVRRGSRFSIVVRSDAGDTAVRALLGPVGAIVSLHLNSTAERYAEDNDRIRRLIERLRTPGGEARRETMALIRAVGMQVTRPFLVIAIRSSADPDDAWKMRLALLRHLPHLGIIDDAGCLLVLAQGFVPATVVDDVLAVLVRRGPRRPAVVSEPLPDVSSVRTAVISLPKQVERVSAPTPARPFDLPSVLSATITDGGRRQASRFLAPLADYDRENNAELMQTLRTYLACDCSPTATADALFIHRNSLTYRLSRIGDILGLSLASMEAKTTCAVALAVADAGPGE